MSIYVYLCLSVSNNVELCITVLPRAICVPSRSHEFICWYPFLEKKSLLSSFCSSVPSRLPFLFLSPPPLLQLAVGCVYVYLCVCVREGGRERETERERERLKEVFKARGF